MTVEQYIANTGSWTPTFTVASLANYTAWKDKAAGNDYERVLILVNITATAGINLTYSQTKQVVFDPGCMLKIDFTDAEDECKCFYRSQRDDDEEMWMYYPYIAGITAPASKNAYGFYNCNNIMYAGIESVKFSPDGVDAVAGDFYGFYNCFNLEVPYVGIVSGSTGYGARDGGDVYCFYGCDSIMEPFLEEITAGDSGSNGLNSGSGGDVYCFYNCDHAYFVNMHDILGGGATDTGMFAAGTGGRAYGFYNCTDVAGGEIRLEGGHGAHFGIAQGSQSSGGAVYGCYNCVDVNAVAIEDIKGGIRGGGFTGRAAAYGFYLCSNVGSTHTKGIESTDAAYGHYMWSGTLLQNSSYAGGLTAMYFPDHGPYALEQLNIPRQGRPVNLTWLFITTGGSTVSKSAVLQVSTDNSTTWTDIYTGTATAYEYSVPSGISNVRFRVSTADSGYLYTDLTQLGPLIVISGTDEDLGAVSASFTPYQFSIARDPEDGFIWDTALIVITLDGETLQTFNAVIGDVKTLSIAGLEWNKVLNGAHTLVIDAKRIINGQPNGADSLRTLTFTKAQNRAVLTLSHPATTRTPDTRPTRISILAQGEFPDGSSLTAEVCNNANDPEPAWEDMTADCLAGAPHMFENSSKLDLDWGVNIRVTLDRGTAQGTCYINSLSGDFS